MPAMAAAQKSTMKMTAALMARLRSSIGFSSSSKGRSGLWLGWCGMGLVLLFDSQLIELEQQGDPQISESGAVCPYYLAFFACDYEQPIVVLCYLRERVPEALHYCEHKVLQ
jgi:hypothetical protein